jgi:hypothetical protein
VRTVDAPEEIVACREVIMEWPMLAQLAEFAQQRHGYGNSDGGFGILYPEDIDEFQMLINGVHIPKGSLLVYGFAIAQPPGYELLVSERSYLAVLVSVLSEAGLPGEAATVRALLTRAQRIE